MEADTFTLYHLVRKPKVNIEKAPLLIMLHGYGSNEEDLFSFAEELPDELFVISVRAPYPLPPYGNAWYAIHWDGSADGKFSDDNQAVISREKIVQFLEEVKTNYPVDPDNVTLVGFSQGCILSFAVALSYPEKIRNVIGLSGYINKTIIKEDFQKRDFSNLSVYSSHGTVDQVIPVAWARMTKPFLDSLKIENVYSEFPVGHGVAPQNFRELKKWLEDRL